MKITANYGISASVNTGVPYEAIKPFYDLSAEMEVLDNLTEDEKTRLISAMVMNLKRIQDPMLLEDMRKYNGVRMKCICKPIFAKGQLIHDEACLMGTALKRE